MKTICLVFSLGFLALSGYAERKNETIMSMGFFAATMFVLGVWWSIRSLSSSLRETKRRDDALIGFWPTVLKHPKDKDGKNLLQ